METIIEYILSKTHLSGLIFILSLLSLKSTGQEYLIGADLSFLKSAEDRGFGFKENNEVKPGLKIFIIQIPGPIQGNSLYQKHGTG